MRSMRWAVTLFSFTNDLLAADRTPDGLLDAVLRDGVADRVEIDAAQHYRSFPMLEAREVEATARVVQRRGGSVSLLGGGADLAPAPGRRIPDEVALAQLGTHVRAAALLGAEGVRMPFGALPWPVLRKAADVARAAGVVLFEEVQGPESPHDPRLLERIVQLDRTGETAVRLLLDTSTLMSGLPGTYVAALRANGVPEAVVAALGTAFAEGHEPAAAVIVPQLRAGSLPPAAASLLITALTRFGHTAPADWQSIVPWIAGVHLKYWDLAQAEQDLAGPVGGVLDALAAAGFAGTVCSEWGGHDWSSPEVDAAAWTREHRRLFDAQHTGSMTDPHEEPEFVLPTHLPPADAWTATRNGRREVLRAQYAIVDGFRPLELDLVAPEGDGPHPVVLWIHGGAWRGGTNRDTAGPVPSGAIRDGLLAAGIAVASVQYRLTAEAPFPAQLHDVVAAVRWLRHYAAELGLDPERVGAWGESAGGHLTAFLGVNVEDAALLGDEGVATGRTDLQAAVPWYPPTDLLTLGADALIPGVPMDHDARDSPEAHLVGGAVQDHPDAARVASPITYASASSAPMLLVHGAADVVVSPRQSERLADALRAAGAEVELVLVPGANHVLVGVDPLPSVQRSIAFLAAHLLR